MPKKFIIPNTMECVIGIGRMVNMREPPKERVNVSSFGEKKLLQLLWSQRRGKASMPLYSVENVRKRKICIIYK